MILLVIIFLAVTLFASFILLLVYRNYYSPELMALRRVEQFTKTAVSSKPDEAGDMPFIVRDDQMSKIPILNIFLERFNLSKSLKKKLAQADLKIKVGELFLYMMILGFLGVLVTIRSHNIVLQLLAPVVLAIAPIIYVNMKRTQRLKAFIREFPDALDMMTSAIRAGHGFNKAIQLVGDEAPDPVSTEFKRTYEEHNLGLQFREAMIKMTERIDSLDLKLFVTAVLLQRETGGNMAEMLEKISYTIRERFKLIGQIKTLTAQGRMSAWIVGGIPIFFILIISMTNPTYLEPLFKDKVGHLFLAMAIALQLIGYFVISRIIKIKYQ